PCGFEMRSGCSMRTHGRRVTHPSTGCCLAGRPFLRAADQMRRRPTLIEHLISTAERSMVFEDINAALGRDILKGDDLKKAEKLIRQYDRPGVDMDRQRTAEKAAMFDTVQALYGGGQFNEQFATQFAVPLGANTEDKLIVRRLAKADPRQALR